MRNRKLKFKRGTHESVAIRTMRDGSQWLVETRWTKLEKDILV